MTASSIREDTDCLADVVAKLSVPSHTEPTETPQLSVEIANFEPFSAIARYTDGQYPKLNDVYWGLFDVVGAPEKVEAILGQPFDDIEGGDIEFICSLKVSTDIKKPLTGYSARRIPGGVAIMMRHRGVYEQLLDTVDHLYLSAIAIPEVQLADEPLLFHYLDDPEEVAEEDLRTDLYLFLELNERPAL
ncbi:MAG: GyrI-like domain-containing protein [Parvularculaceae bacterium]|nr:GyrI-like domain-containing protein [Parvularculaceae bacterium]